MTDHPKGDHKLIPQTWNTLEAVTKKQNLMVI